MKKTNNIVSMPIRLYCASCDIYVGEIRAGTTDLTLVYECPDCGRTTTFLVKEQTVTLENGEPETQIYFGRAPFDLTRKAEATPCDKVFFKGLAE